MEVKGTFKESTGTKSLSRSVSPSPLLMSLISESKKVTSSTTNIDDGGKTEKMPVFTMVNNSTTTNKTNNPETFVNEKELPTNRLNVGSAFTPIGQNNRTSESSMERTESASNRNIRCNSQIDMATYRQLTANPTKSNIAAAPSFLNLVRTKLEEEKAKSERPQLRRRITEHDDPLYALVVKETLLEYEEKTLRRQETLRRQATVIIDDYDDDSIPPYCDTSPDFLDIMERRIAEKAAEVMPSIKNETVTDLYNVDDEKEENGMIKESNYASVLLETLRDYEKLKTEQSLTKKVAKSFGFSFQKDSNGSNSPNFLSLLEQKLIEKNIIDTNIAGGGDGDDSIGALIVKGALLENRNRHDVGSGYSGVDRKSNQDVSFSSTTTEQSKARIHPHHINRPFWCDTTEDEVISTPTSPDKDSVFEKAATASLKIKNRPTTEAPKISSYKKDLDLGFTYPSNDDWGLEQYDVEGDSRINETREEEYISQNIENESQHRNADKSHHLKQPAATQHVSQESNTNQDNVYITICRVSPRLPSKHNHEVQNGTEQKSTGMIDKSNDPDIPQRRVDSAKSTESIPAPYVDRSVKPKSPNPCKPISNSSPLDLSRGTHTSSEFQSVIPPPDYSPLSSPQSTSDDENVFVDEWPAPPPSSNPSSNTNTIRSQSPYRPVTPVVRNTMQVVERYVDKPNDVLSGNTRQAVRTSSNERTESASQSYDGAGASNTGMPLKSHHFAFIHGRPDQQGTSSLEHMPPIPDRSQKPMK